ncbi:hypothetical protein TWF730_000010 [Orbilia blumenaviensis]|uniref:Fucose-specific lectin n=1 Tax=Orbilia blumenaviensis TaxID=1796055 RepID=A0AAV9VLE0_9PEZI
MAASYCNQPGYAVISGFTDPNDERQTPQILVFYNTANSNLAVQLWRGDKSSSKDDEDVFCAKSDDRVGFVSYLTDLAAAALSGTNVVVGFTEAAPADGCQSSVHKVSILSPVYQTLDDTDIKNTSISIASSNPLAVSNDDDDAWVYYLKTNSHNKLSIYEYSLGDSAAAPLGANPTLGSSLAAYWDGSTRWVIYQGSADGDNDYQLFEHDPGSDSDTKIAGTGGGGTNCRIAVAYDAGSQTTYLYFTTENGDIFRSIKDGKTNRWKSSATQISDDAKSKVANGSQLAAIYSGGVVHLFFANKAGSFKGHVVDTLSQKAERRDTGISS